MTHGRIVGSVQGLADLIRDTFERARRQDVISPFTALRRLDGLPAPTETNVLRTWAGCRGTLDEAGLLDQVMRRLGDLWIGSDVGTCA